MNHSDLKIPKKENVRVETGLITKFFESECPEGHGESVFLLEGSVIEAFKLAISDHGLMPSYRCFECQNVFDYSSIERYKRELDL